MKKILSFALILMITIACFSSCNKSENSQTATTPTGSSSTEKLTWPEHTAPKLEEIDMSVISSLDGVSESATQTDYVMIKVKGMGDIVVRLYPDVAPLTVKNFQKLVSEKFYDGLTFHRVIKNFMIQGGDPLGTGIGSSSVNIRGEFSNNGWENNLPHKRGVISMARNGLSMDSASSQFFICQKTKSHLDGDYASFGYVIYGLDVVDAIASVKTDTNDKPLDDIVIESIRFVNVNTTQGE